jgi:hypothetical protein
MSRASVVAVLVAAEIAIAGMALYVVGHGGVTFAAGMQHVDFKAAPIAPLAAGATPHVVIDDVSSRVTVGTSTDGLVHVRDLTEIRGAVFSSAAYPGLQVTRTPDGVRIERPHGDHFSVEVFGWSTQAIAVELPPGARLEIARCAGADVDGITGGVSVHSTDGHITLSDLQGAVDAQSADGSVSAKNVRGDRLAVEAADGRLIFDDVTVGSLTGTTRDGSISANDLTVSGNASLQTDDGTVRAKFAPDADVTIDASTRDGSITVDGRTVGHDAAEQTIKLGAGNGRLQLSTTDGSIHILTNGAYQSDGL